MKSFSFYWTDELGKAINQAAVEHCPDDTYSMSLTDPLEFQAVVNAINQGIDSHLEAIQFTHTTSPQCAGNICYVTREDITVNASDLSTLVRRLMEKGGDVDMDIASSICTTLNIELI